MRWRRKQEPEPTQQSDGRFESDVDAWEDTAPPDPVETTAPDAERDAWDDATLEPLPSDPEPAPTATVAPSLPARPDVPVDLGRVDDDELARSRRRVIARALAEDLGPAGDVTSIATVPPSATGSAALVAREDLVVAGVDCVAEVFRQLDPRVEVTAHVVDGDDVTAGATIATVEGPLRTILTGERCALNLVARLSGIATHVRRHVALVDGTGVAVRDTRKTTPGLRLLEKAAVAAGGGANHRIGLHDALLVKDNHVLAAGSAGEAARQAMARSGGRHVQVEVTSIDQLDEVLAEGVVDVLLDNFTTDELREAVAHVAGRAALEASGGITLDTIADVAATGVDRLALGALTHQATWCDVALDVTEVEQRVAVAPVPARPVERVAPPVPDTEDDAPHMEDEASPMEDEDTLTDDLAPYEDEPTSLADDLPPYEPEDDTGSDDTGSDDMSDDESSSEDEDDTAVAPLRPVGDTTSEQPSAVIDEPLFGDVPTPPTFQGGLQPPPPPPS